MKRKMLYNVAMRRLRAVLCVMTLFFFSYNVWGSGDRYREYIDLYSAYAVEQQTAYGIPASITLAQGLLESGAGRSTLATRGNNHFGIKCHNTWKGDTMLRDDDAVGECFRVYADAAESFEDHSRFLSKGRYRPLFELAAGDYAGWARGLSKCGYATDPNYADKLITIIERYALFEFDLGGVGGSPAVADFIRESLVSSHIVRRSRGLYYVVALPGDTYTGVASEFGIDPAVLAAYNDARTDDPVRDWGEIYLQPKLDNAPEGVGGAVIGEGESLHSVAQRYGMKVSVIRALNPKLRDVPGQKLKLR